jgi:hypothetical protein
MSWHTYTHHTLKSLLRVVQVLVFVVLPGIVVWLQFVGLPRALHQPLVEAAQRQGLDLEFDRMRLSLLQGLVLDKVRLRAALLPENPDVGIDRAAISLNFRQLLRGRVELNALDLHGAQLYLPVSSERGTAHMLRLTKARARLLLADGVVSIPVARFNLQGIEITGSGQILLTPGKSAPSGAIIPTEVARALEIIESLDFGDQPPQLDLEFSAHSGDATSLQLSRIVLDAPQLVYEGLSLRDLRLIASYADGSFEVQRLLARDQTGGLLDAAGYWNMLDGSANAKVISTLDPTPWLRHFVPGGPWQELSLTESPALQVTLDVPAGDTRRWRVLGTAACPGVTFRKVKLGSINGGFAWQDGTFYASDVILGLPSGQLSLDVLAKPGDYRMRVEGRADPLPLTALLGERDRRGIEKMNLEFIDPPKIQLEAAGEKIDPKSLRAWGKIELARTSIHDSPFDQGSADVSFENHALTFSNINVSRPEGKASGSFTYDFGRRQVRLEGVRSTMNPYQVLQWASPVVAEAVTSYRFKAPPEVTVGGVVGVEDASQTRLWANFNAAQGFDYDLLERTITVTAASGTLDITGRRIKVNIPAAKLYGGKARFDAEIATGQPDATQKISVELDSVDFETLTRLYFGYRDSQGRLSGRYDFTFVPGNASLMRGTGRLIVEDGNVFAIPVLGPLSMLLDGVIPGAGYQTARQATCDFRVVDGTIRTDNLDIIGRGFSIIGEGSLFFLRDRMDFAVRVNAQGVPGLLLYPVSKLFEYVSDGKLSDPQWRPKNIPTIPGRDAAPGKSGNGN